MKTHFGFMEDLGSYEQSLFGCEETICGCYGELVLEEYTTDSWESVTCKKCLRLKGRVIKGQLEDEKHIVQQMGDMVEFMEKNK